MTRLCTVVAPEPAELPESGDGASVSQAPSAGSSGPRPSQGRWAEALRPAWASWMPILALPCRRQKPMTRASAASLASE